MPTEATKKAIAKYKAAKRKHLSAEVDKKYYEEVIVPFLESRGISLGFLIKRGMQYAIEHPDEVL